MSVLCRQAVKGCRVRFSLSFSHHESCNVHLRKCSLPQYNKWMWEPWQLSLNAAALEKWLLLNHQFVYRYHHKPNTEFIIFLCGCQKACSAPITALLAIFFFFFSGWTKVMKIEKMCWSFMTYVKVCFCITHIGNVKVSSLTTSLLACHFLSTKVVLLHDLSCKSRQRHVMCSNDNQGNPKHLCKTFWIYALQTLLKFFFSPPKHWLLNNTIEQLNTQPEGQWRLETHSEIQLPGSDSHQNLDIFLKQTGTFSLYSKKMPIVHKSLRSFKGQLKKGLCNLLV